MKPSRSKSMFNIFTLFTLPAMLFGILPASPVQAKAPASPLFASGDFVWAKSMGGAADELGQTWTWGYSAKVSVSFPAHWNEPLFFDDKALAASHRRRRPASHAPGEMTAITRPSSCASSRD